MLRVLIAESSRVVCDSIQRVLSAEEDIFVVGSAATQDEILFALPHANLVLLSASFGKGMTTHLIGLIRKEKPEARLLVMSAEEDVESMLGYIEAGAFGYILQQDPLDVLIRKMRAASLGEAIVTPEMVAQLMTRLSQLSQLHQRNGLAVANKQSCLHELTSREMEVLRLISQGFSNHEIAHTLFIEYGTVKNHVHHILEKLEVSTRNQAATIYTYPVKAEPLSVYMAA